MIVLESGWMEHQRRRWMRHDAIRWIRPNIDSRVGDVADSQPRPATVFADAQQLETAIRRARWHAAALRFHFALFEDQRRIKAGFDPNQPRAPKGGPDGGQWIGGEDNPANSADTQFHIRQHKQLEDPPHIPEIAPATTRLRNIIIKEAAIWLAKAAVREIAGGPVVGTFLNALEAATWIYEGLPYIRAYLDAPKTLEELQQAALFPQRGYDIHHIVEKSAAYKDGFSETLVEGRENLVRLPTLKHWEITAWYMTKNRGFNGLSPREYLVGRDWDERIRLGHHALEIFEVKKP